MRFIFFTALWLILFVVGAFAQITTPPPKVAVVSKDLEFVSEEGGFKAKFPAKPTKSVKTIDVAFGKTDYTVFQHVSNLAVYMIAYLDFPTVIKDPTELRIRYDGMKNAMTEKVNTKLIEEREIYFGDNLGRDFIIENGNLTLTMRCVVIEQRLFQLTVTTRGNISKATATVKKYNNKLVDNFFNSFSVTKLPSPKTVAVDFPEDFGIKIQDSNFRSDFLKFTVALPKDWNIIDAEEAEYYKELGIEESKTQLPKSAKELDFSNQNTKILLTMMNQDSEKTENTAVLVIGVEKTSFPNFFPSAITDNYIKRFLEPSELVITKTNVTKIGGLDFAWIETSFNQEKRYQRLYVANRNGIALQIHFSYHDTKDLEVLKKLLQSIKFDEFENLQK